MAVPLREPCAKALSALYQTQSTRSRPPSIRRRWETGISERLPYCNQPVRYNLHCKRGGSIWIVLSESRKFRHSCPLPCYRRFVHRTLPELLTRFHKHLDEQLVTARYQSIVEGYIYTMLELCELVVSIKRCDIRGNKVDRSSKTVCKSRSHITSSSLTEFLGITVRLGARLGGRTPTWASFLASS